MTVRDKLDEAIEKANAVFKLVAGQSHYRLALWEREGKATRLSIESRRPGFDLYRAGVSMDAARITQLAEALSMVVAPFVAFSKAESAPAAKAAGTRPKLTKAQREQLTAMGIDPDSVSASS